MVKRRRGALWSRENKSGRLTLAEPAALQLVALWTHAGELPGLVDTLELAQVAGVAALVDVC